MRRSEQLHQNCAQVGLHKAQHISHNALCIVKAQGAERPVTPRRIAILNAILLQTIGIQASSTTSL